MRTSSSRPVLDEDPFVLSLNSFGGEYGRTVGLKARCLLAHSIRFGGGFSLERVDALAGTMPATRENIVSSGRIVTQHS